VPALEAQHVTASQALALDAVAFQLLAALDRYEVSIDEMLLAWPDLGGYNVASAGIDEVQRYCSSLPRLSVGFVSLLIARAEMIQCLFAHDPADPEKVAACARSHAAALAGLRDKCKRLLCARR
jgi:hypothetical protein